MLGTVLMKSRHFCFSYTKGPHLALPQLSIPWLTHQESQPTGQQLHWLLEIKLLGDTVVFGRCQDPPQLLLSRHAAWADKTETSIKHMYSVRTWWSYFLQILALKGEQTALFSILGHTFGYKYTTSTPHPPQATPEVSPDIDMDILPLPPYPPTPARSQSLLRCQWKPWTGTAQVLWSMAKQKHVLCEKESLIQ